MASVTIGAAPAARAPTNTPVSDRLLPRVSTRSGLALFAGAVYVPILLMHVGKVEADTKQYLYLDPGRLLERAATIWDPSIGMGTLSHQTLGYVFPSGPYYWVTETLLGLPAWVAQRLWLATIVFAAGLGMRYMLRSIGVVGAGVPVAMVAYAFTPYVVQYAGLYSVFLGPWAALPWWIGFTARGLRVRSWFHPALFAVTVQLVGALNATALFLCLIGPALWVVHARFVARDASWRATWSFVSRTAVLTGLTSLWWIVGLLVEGRYGVNLLRFTETLETVSQTALPSEFLRGLGFWFFYGRDIVGLWNDGMQEFTRSVVILAGLAIPALAFLSAGTVRWRHRFFFVTLVVAGMVISVGAAPYHDPSVFGALWKSFASESNTGMALRNSGRAVPLIVLGTAALLGAGVSALVTWLQGASREQLARRVVAAVGVLCVVNAAGSWGGRYYSRYLERDEEIPAYWTDAIAAIDAKPHDTRVLALPGADFATYRWGDTRDPIEPGLMDRPYVAREIVPWGTPPSINLLRALDSPLQQGVFDPNALAPVARLMGVGDVVLRMDLATDRWSLLPASQLWRTFTDEPVPGLRPPERYGTKIPGELRFPDIGDLAVPPDAEPSPPPVAVLAVDDALPIVRAKPDAAPLVVDGDGVGLVSAAGAGLVDARRLVLYSQWYRQDPDRLRRLPRDATLVVTDSNRRRGERWSRMYNNYGYTEQAGEVPLVENPLSQPLELFPEIGDDARTVTVMHGVKSVQATTYGDRVFGLTPAQRPSRVLDGDTETSWAINAGLPVRRERLRIELLSPISTDRVGLVQLLGDDQERWITEVTLRFDGRDEVDATLGDASLDEAGQTVTFPKRTFSTLEIEVTDVREPGGLALAKRNAVGFSEVRLADDATGQPVRVDEVARLPRDLLDALGAASLEHPLAIVLSRDVMDDTSMQREFTLPTARSFTILGTAVISRQARDHEIDRRLGLPDARRGGITARGKHPFGRPVARASSAIDGDLRTAWNTPLGSKVPKEYLRIETPDVVAFDHLDLVLVQDGRHSVPTEIEITSDRGERRLVTVPPGTSGDNGTVRSRVELDTLRGRRFEFVVKKFREVKRSETVMPVGIAELGIPGVRRPALGAELPADCIDDLVRVDGRPFPVRVSGTVDDALQQRPLHVEPCEPGTTLTLPAGAHRIDVRVSPKTDSALDIGRLVLTSAPGGAASPASAVAAFPAARGGAPPGVRVVEQGRASMTVRIDGASAPFWFVLGQSHNEGWVAKADGHDLGPSELVDGYANGWRVTPRDPGAPITLTLAWEPQGTVWKAMVVSAVAGALCLVIVAGALWRRRRVTESPGGDVPPVLRNPIGGVPATSRPRARWVAVVCSGSLAAVFVRPWAGLLVAAVVFLAVRRPRWRLALRLLPAGVVIAVAFGIAAAQEIRRYPRRFEWPTFFEWARNPVWIAIMLLAADALVALVTRDDEVDHDAAR